MSRVKSIICSRVSSILQNWRKMFFDSFKKFENFKYKIKLNFLQFFKRSAIYNLDQGSRKKLKIAAPEQCQYSSSSFARCGPHEDPIGSFCIRQCSTRHTWQLDRRRRATSRACDWLRGFFFGRGVNELAANWMLICANYGADCIRCRLRYVYCFRVYCFFMAGAMAVVAVLCTTGC